jgi:hypothetical protein
MEFYVNGWRMKRGCKFENSNGSPFFVVENNLSKKSQHVENWLIKKFFQLEKSLLYYESRFGEDQVGLSGIFSIFEDVDLNEMKRLQVFLPTLTRVWKQISDKSLVIFQIESSLMQVLFAHPSQIYDQKVLDEVVDYQHHVYLTRKYGASEL